MGLGGEPVHAVLPGAIPVAILEMLVQENGMDRMKEPEPGSGERVLRDGADY